jgi:hypothetical protein
MAIFFVLLVLAAVAAALPAAEGGAGPGERARLGGGGAVRWDGPTRSYPKAMIAECLSAVRRLVRQSRRFGPPTEADSQALTEVASRLSAKYGQPLDASQLMSMRTLEVGFEARTGGVRAMRHGPALLAACRAGESLVAIAARHRLPPMAVLRQILLEQGLTVANVRALLANPARLTPPLSSAAYEAAAEADLGSRAHAERIRERSQAFEVRLGRHLRELGLRFRTEDELRHANGPGSDRPTPDYLLSEPATIDGHPVNWLDAKDYPMYGAQLVARNIAAQVRKYTAAFGPGAMVFSGGVLCDAGGGAGALLLDGSHIAAEDAAGLRPA